jgi:hypothetical protein
MAHKNFAYSLVATQPSPQTTGTSLVVTAGQGVLFPAVPFNVTIWPASVQPISTNAEIVTVTSVSTDTFTITRHVEGTSAISIGTGYQIAATITAKTLQDVETREAEIDFGSGKPKYDASFTVTDADVTTSSKISVSPSGNVATSRVGNDWEWDGVIMAALAGIGNFSLYCTALPGPIVGKRKIYYTIA